jgi:hypothetical protein
MRYHFFSEELMFKIRTFIFRLFSMLMLLLLLVSVLRVTPARAAGRRYTAPIASGTGDCSSWANACTLQTALTGAAGNEEIWVKTGTHKPTTGTDRSATFQLKNYLTTGVALYGGFSGTETARDQRNPASNVTTLSGEIGAAGNSDNSYHVVTGVDNALLDGFTITAGNANGAGSNNSGGGMYNSSSSPILMNVAFSANSADFGGGMYNESGSSPTLTNVTFSANSATSSGGGMYNYGSSPTLTNVTFSANSAGSGGGGMFNETGSPTLTNVTFSGNSATNGGGMSNAVSGNPQIRNTIFWGNTAPTAAQISNNTSAPVVSDSVIQGGCPSGSSCTNIIITDPNLGALGNYGGSTQTIPLLSGSSAIDTGNDGVCPAADQRGVARQGAHCDIGAFEFASAISGYAGVVGATLSYTDGSPKTATADGSGNYSFLVSYNWSGTVTPSKTGYTFSPASRPYTSVLADQTAQDYTATPITYAISGNAGVAGATLSYTDGAARTATADGSGNYSFTVSYNWSGTVTPSKTGYTFTPASKPYTNVLANQTAQDYTATPITYAISGNAGVAGATLSYTDGAAKTATADGSGNYSFLVSYNWSGTVTPSKTGYTFSPASRPYTNVLADQTAQDYIATVTYSISGNAGIAGATLSYTDGVAKTATADGSGNYSLLVSYNWSGTITPSMTGYTFTPANKSYTNVLANQTAQDYTTTAITYTISGNAGIAGATLSYTDVTNKTATANDSGNYSLLVPYNWSGTVTPSKTGYIFSTPKSYTNVLANQTAQDYTATAVTYTISGTARVAGATLSYTDGIAKTATADGNGDYLLTVSYNWSGAVTPFKAGFTFSPVKRDYANVIADQFAQDYIATPITYTVSGTAGVAGATLSYTDSVAKIATADSNGNYSFAVSYNWSGAVTPSQAGFIFSPIKRDYASVIADQPAQDYSAYAPAGYITDTTPTYTWTKISGATQYQYQLMKGTAVVYVKSVGAAACKSITCSNTPSTVLGLGSYKWRVMAKVGGKWQAYSPFKTFKLAVKPKAGKWDCQSGCQGGRNDVVFYVTPNQASVDKFTTVFYCGSIPQVPVTHPQIPIKNNGFSFTGSIYVKNAKFLTPTHLSGIIGTLHHDFLGCPDTTFPPSVWEAVWRDKTQPFAAGSGVEENPLELILSGFDFASIFIIEPAP